MTESIIDEIERGWQLLNEGNEKEALQLIVEIGKIETLLPEERLKDQILKGFIVVLLGKFEEALEISK